MQPGESAGAQVAVAAPQSVGGALDLLREQGYEVLHEVRWPGRRRATIDHVAIGPAGILVVDAKNWSGNVSVLQGRVRQDGNGRDKELAGVLRAGDAVADLLPVTSAAHVMPVLCLAGEHDIEPTLCGEVVVLDLKHLRDWVVALPPHLAEAEAVLLANTLRGKLPSAAAPIPKQQARRRAGQPAAAPAAPVAFAAPVALAAPAAAVPAAPVAPAAPAAAVPAPAPAFTSIASQLERSSHRAAATRTALRKLTVLLLLAVALAGALFWWSANGQAVKDALFPAAVAPPAAALPHTPVFDSCRDLRASHPGGVASPGAHNTGRKLRRSALVLTSRPLYAANARLDKDGDHIACEVVRKRTTRR